MLTDLENQSQLHQRNLLGYLTTQETSSVKQQVGIYAWSQVTYHDHIRLLLVNCYDQIACKTDRAIKYNTPKNLGTRTTLIL